MKLISCIILVSIKTTVSKIAMKSYLWLNLQCLNLVAYTGQVRVPRAAWITVLVILFLLTRMSFHPTESACFNRLQVLFRSFGLPFFARRIALFFICSCLRVSLIHQVYQIRFVNRLHQNLFVIKKNISSF